MRPNFPILKYVDIEQLLRFITSKLDAIRHHPELFKFKIQNSKFKIQNSNNILHYLTFYRIKINTYRHYKYYANHSLYPK